MGDRPHRGPGVECENVFRFRTERRLVRLTGRKARNLRELLGHLHEVSGSSIFYHTHHLYLAHHFEKPVFFNEFAGWSSHALQDRALAEKLAAIDLLAFPSIRGLRNEIVATIDRHLAAGGDATRAAPAGDEFHFCESQSFVLPTGIEARDAADFFRKLPRVSTTSIFYHFFEARLRLGRLTNDFSRWLEDSGEGDLAQAIDKLNPYLMTLDQLKRKIIRIGRSRMGASGVDGAA